LASSGVPQGSHLGPVLFIVSTFDAPSLLNYSKLLSYADDTKIFKEISYIRDCNLLQQDLSAFESWCKNNSLNLNIAKCQVMSFSRKAPASIICFDYKLNGVSIERVQKVRDLGIDLDPKLTFKEQYESMIHKANSTLGFIRRWSREFLDPDITKQLYVTYVRPILEYLSQVWSPYREIYIDRIEAVQKRFLRFALRYFNWPDPFNLPAYEYRLLFLNLPTLYNRRIVSDFLFVYQIVNGVVYSPSIREQINFRSNPHNLRDVELFDVPSHSTDYGKYEPITRMLQEVNQLSRFFDLNISMNSLRTRLLCHLTELSLSRLQRD